MAEKSSEIIRLHKQELNNAKKADVRVEEGAAYCNLGRAYYAVGDFKHAIECHKQHLAIAKEMEDRADEGVAYCNLGMAYHRLGDFKQAIEFHNRDLEIAKELGDQAGQGTSYGNLGNSYHSLGDFKQAIEYHTLHLRIAKEVGNRAEEGVAYCNLGRAYRWLGDFKQAVDFHKRDLNIAKDLKDKAGEGTTYGNLGNVYHSIGDFKQAIEYHTTHLNIAKDVEDRAGEGHAYGDLGRAYHGVGDFEKAIECHKHHISIAKEVGNRAGKGRAYGNLGRAYHSIGNFKQAIKYHNRHLRIAKEVKDRVGEGIAYGKLGNAFESLGDFEQAMEFYTQHLCIAKEVGDRSGEGSACYSLGRVFELMGFLHEAVDCFQSSLDVYNGIKVLLKSEDSWKINFCYRYHGVYIALCRTLLKLQKRDEALRVAEQGRAQALIDRMRIQFALLLSASDESKETIPAVINDLSAQTLFIALDNNLINFWVLCKGEDIHFRQTEIEGKDSVTFVQCLTENAEGGLRSVDESTGDLPLNKESGQEKEEALQSKDHPLRLLYDSVIRPIADLLHGDELIIVPDGPLFMAPYAAFIDQESKYLSESFRIRIVPSLSCLKLITDCPKGHHSDSGALLIGDPCMEEITNPMGRPIYKQVPSTRKEVEIIGEILKTTPLTGKQATKDEVLKRIGLVALVHIAACAKIDSPEIALAPNSTTTSKIPEKGDYILTAEDLQTVNLRARLVVLSCCHSGLQPVKSKGVVGIVRAFLGAGARSVLLSLWRSDEEATIELMRIFYQHLAEGNSASVALQLAMKCLRESEKFGAVKYWAPFVLIGDDVTISFGGEEEVP